MSPRRRVLMTRAAGDNGELREALLAGGAEPVEVPLLAFAPTGAPIPELAPDDLVVLTSATAVGQLVARRRLDLLFTPFVAAVGPSTARAIAAVARPPDLVPDRALADALAEALGPLRGRRVLHPRAEEVPEGFERRLKAAGAELVPVPLYRTVCPPGAGEALRRALPVEVITLASGSAARHLAALGQPPGDARVVAIGPSTAAEARRCGLEVFVVARPHTAQGLALAALAVL